jgi:hypothetical protein
MPGNFEIEKIRCPLPIPRNPKEQFSLAKKEKKLVKIVKRRLKRKNNHEKEIKIKIGNKDPYRLFLFRRTVLRRDEVIELKIPLDELTEI